MTLDIMMPFYGRPDHLTAAVDSVLAQSDPDWRLTVIDDAYPDPAPGRRVETINDSRVRLLRNAVNLGPSRNFARSVDLMEFEHSVIMGCDDVMMPGFVAHVADLLRRFPDVAVIQPGVEVIDDRGSVHRPIADRTKGVFRPRTRGASPHVVAGEPLAASLLRATWTYFPSLVWRVEALRRHEFRSDLGIVQDLPLLLDIIADGGSFLIDPRIVFRYRRHAGSVSQANDDGLKFAEERAVYSEYARRFDAMGWRRAARAAHLRPASRLHAGRDLAAAARSSGSPELRRALARHTFGRNGSN